MKIGKFLEALADWLFVWHGYYRYQGVLRGTSYNIVQINAEAKAFKRGVIKQYKCKQCGGMFLAFRRNDTCSRLKCFFGYRMR